MPKIHPVIRVPVEEITTLVNSFCILKQLYEAATHTLECLYSAVGKEKKGNSDVSYFLRSRKIEHQRKEARQAVGPDVLRDARVRKQKQAHYIEQCSRADDE